MDILVVINNKYKIIIRFLRYQTAWTRQKRGPFLSGLLGFLGFSYRNAAWGYLLAVFSI